VGGRENLPGTPSSSFPGISGGSQGLGEGGNHCSGLSLSLLEGAAYVLFDEKYYEEGSFASRRCSLRLSTFSKLLNSSLWKVEPKKKEERK
jgi:hypothetical protein